MRIVLDTNVLARAGYSSTGPAAAVLHLVKESTHALVTSLFILDELDRVLRYPRLRAVHGFTDDEIVRFVSHVQAASLVVATEADTAKVVPNDPDDDPVVATAVTGKAHVICTLDKHLRQENVREHCRRLGVRIMTDVELLAELRSVDSEDD